MSVFKVVVDHERAASDTIRFSEAPAPDALLVTGLAQAPRSAVIRRAVGVPLAVARGTRAVALSATLEQYKL